MLTGLNELLLKCLPLLFCIALIFGCGWYVRGARDNALVLQHEQTLQEKKTQLDKQQEMIASKLEGKLSELSQKRQVVQQLTTKEIVTKPIYRMECFDASGVEFVNKKFAQGN